MRHLVTGGAGFIGSHVTAALLERGHSVTVLDSLDPQVHGDLRERPEYLDARARLVVGDVRDRGLVTRLVRDADAVIHLAASVGLAQSMYEMERFVDVNCRGTAIILEAATANGSAVRKIVVASSMSLYGEGRCRCSSCGEFDPELRTEKQLEGRDFEIRCPSCGAPAVPVPTPETAPLHPTTVYAVTKRDQEDMVLAVAAAYGITATALRLFNCYGPGQSLSNPYTGAAAIFASRMLNGNAPIVFEDGLQTRDFTHVHDVAEAIARAAERDGDDGVVLNVGTGRSYTLLALGTMLAAALGVEWRPAVDGTFRRGDIRHCTADGARLMRVLGWRPQIDLKDGVTALAEWARDRRPQDNVERALLELRSRSLAV